MKKKVCLGVAIVSLWSAGNVFAQGEIDAYKFSQSELSGTARYMSMAIFRSWELILPVWVFTAVRKS